MAINYNEEEFGLQVPNNNQGIMEVADLYNTPDGSIPYWGPEQYNYNEGMLNTPSNPETLNFTEAVNEYGYPLMASLSGSIPNKVSALDQMANYDWSGFDNNIAKNMALAKQMNTSLDNTLDNTLMSEALIDENRIPGRIQESVPNYQGWFERMMSGVQNKLGGAWGKTKELGSRFKEGAAPVLGLASMIGNATNPLNPKAFNYSPDLAAQLNFMDKQFPGMMINNPTSGLLQYAQGSPLQGQNVMSMFGSNDPIAQLEKQMARHQKTIDNFANQWGNLKEDDIDAYNQKLNIHKNRLKNAKTLHDTLVGNKKAREAAAAKAAQAAHDAQMAKSGITVSSGGYQGTGDRGRGGQGAFKEDVASMRSAGRSYTDAHGNTGYSRGRKDGGRIGYANGGLASLFTRRG